MIRHRRWLRVAVPSIAIFCCSAVAKAQGAAPPPTGPAPPPAAPPPSAPPPPAEDQDQALVQQAQASSAAAVMAPSTSEAKAHAKVATSAASQLDASKTATPQDKAKANQAANVAQQSATQKQTSDSLCGALSDGVTPKSVCFVYGLFAASLSFVNVVGEGSGTGSVFSGQSNHHLTSIAVPFAGIRFLPQVWAGVKTWGFISLDIAGYSAFLSQNLGSASPSAAKVSCSTVGGDFTLRLPCEANAAVEPYLGAYVGVTVGKSGLAYLTLIPFTFGIAQVGIDSGLRGYSGWSVGALQINGNL